MLGTFALLILNQCNICTIISTPRSPPNSVVRLRLPTAERALISLIWVPLVPMLIVSGAQVTQPKTEAGVLQPRRRQPSRGPLLLFLILVAAALGGLYLVGRPRLEFTNQLAGPVRLAVDAAASRVVPPGSSVRVAAPWGRTMVAAWELDRPFSADGRPMGEEMRGSVVERGSWGIIRRSVRARGPDGNYFAPLITNASQDQLRVTVNAGLDGALDCGCAVRPAGRRVFLGYYRLYQNSTVQAKASDGRAAIFRDLGPSVVAPDGTIGLRFESRDLRAP